MNSQYDDDLFSHPFLENGVFWIALMLLSMDVTTTFYYQGTAPLETMSPHIYRYNPSEAEASSDSLPTIYNEGTRRPRTVISLGDAGVR